jgi:formylglycine-generating enzyme required for sulfatase activity
MMTTDVSSAAFYCPLHQVRFHATPAEVIKCDQTSHAVGYGFPDKSLWTYCCACATFSPHEPTGHNSSLTECPVCERQVAKRCLCHSCQVITIESAALIHRKSHSIDSNGVKPSCPGCGSAPGEKVLKHDCPELDIDFLTARPSCEFCELPIATEDQQPIGEAGEMSCKSCGAELVAPYRFCKRCGTAQSQPEPDDTEQRPFVQETEFAEDSPEEPASIHQATYDSWDYSATPISTKRRTPWLIGGATGLVSIVILIAVAVTNPNRTPRTTEPGPSIPSPQTQAPPGMVYISGGEFLMGNNTGDEYERPAHKVSVAPFYMDVTEVTCEEYLKFLKETGRRDPRHWTTQTCPAGAAKQPATGVDWNDAKSYADWAHKRLPTESEWEFAARGVLSAAYPWGNEWRPNAANAGDSSAHHLMNVASYPNGKTPAGVMDLIGNAWEWTSSEVTVYPGGSLSSPIQENVKIVRGGSWREPNQQATTTYRGYLHMTDAEDYSGTGFRCVKDVGPTPMARSNP